MAIGARSTATGRGGAAAGTMPPRRAPEPGGRVDPKPTLVAMSRHMRRARPVFIVGEARSGSTLLYHTLLKHPSFAPRDENLQESSFVVQAPDAATFDTAPPRNLRRFLLDDDAAWEAFLASIRPLKPWLRAAAAAPSAALRWQLGPAVLVARSFAHHAWLARGCDRLIEKTPDHVHHIERLYAAFPGARLLYVHRHPVDVYSSYVRRGQVDPKADWARLDVEAFCQRHRDRTEQALAAARRHPATFRLVRYERLTNDPEGELRRIARFLAEPPELDAMLRPDPDPGRIAHWERTHHLYAGITTCTKRWQDYCTPAQATQLQQQLADLMDRLDYRPYGASNGPSTSPSLQAAP
jgi:hypothetical protein